VATLNSATYVRKNHEDQDRGRVTEDQIAVLERRLTAIDPARLRSAVRVALIHHHPVLIPALTEPKRGDDAVHNSALLLATLRKLGFHVLLHGHKHNPHVFTEDAFSAYRKGEPHPILIAAGGSVGSRELPTRPRCGNCYNRIIVKWDAQADQTRVHVTTRGLRVVNDDANDLPASNRTWETLRVDDRQFIGRDAPTPRADERRDYAPEADGSADAERISEYGRVNGYFPVVAVVPSLEPDQRNEARLWIVRHEPSDGRAAGPELTRVTWSAGPRFPVVNVRFADDPNLCTVLHDYGPMLVRARMEFVDNTTADAYVYVRLPRAIE
jgi:hypothetical protein